MKMIINGKKVDSESGLTFDIINPATGEVIEAVPKAIAIIGKDFNYIESPFNGLNAVILCHMGSSFPFDFILNYIKVKSSFLTWSKVCRRNTRRKY